MSFRTDGPFTSREAYESVDASRLEELVYLAIYVLGPMTSEEVAEALCINLQSITPRFAPMERKRLIRKTGGVRRGRSGHSRQLWDVIEKKE